MLDAEQLFFSLKEKVKSYSPDESDLELLDRAFEFARSCHGEQTRISGEEYIIHPIEVALVLADLELDLDSISAGLLHDVIEDTSATENDLRELFGSEITLLVDGVTKLSKFNFKTKEEHQAENLRKMFFAMANDIRVILIKLADRTHNMRTLNYLNEKKQKEIAKETMEIYAPLANRLGIYKIKWELEDLAFRYLEPEQYYYLADKIVQKRMEREEYIKKIREDLQVELAEMGIQGEVQGRPKHLYSIYSKMKKSGKDLNEIYDLIALRIIVNSVKDCYAVLGTVHTMWKPVPGRFKDYIAVPKSNMYQSLHTTVLCPQGNLVEIQIRTWEMHKTAEYGIAAHWRYKENTGNDEKFAEKVSWFRQLMEWQQDTSDAQEFMEHLKVDLFSDEVFVFTPKGDVIDLPKGSTPIDFAYRIHTDIGNTCIGAKISGRMVTLDYQLKTGDVVEIMTSKQASPSRDWLKQVKTSQAKNKIRQWFKRQRRDENIQRGKESLEKEVKRLKIIPEKYLRNENVQQQVAEKFNMKSFDDLLAAIGYGGITVNQIIGKFQAIYKEQEESEQEETEEDLSKYITENAGIRKKSKSSINVQGLENISTRFAKCCHPLPGEEIVGFITRTRGITIHRYDCPNAQKKLQDNESTVPVYWEQSGDSDFQVSISVFAVDRQRIVQDIMKILGDSKIVVAAIDAKADSNQVAKINLTVLIRNHSHLQFVIDKLQNINDVLKVQRDNP